MSSDQAEKPPSDTASGGGGRPPDPTNPRDPTAAEGAPAHAARARPGDALLGRALALVRYLREGCDWDAAQTSRSLRPYLLEEAHEVADAILADDAEALPGELGDLLLNLAFQIVVAEEEGGFDAPEVVRRLEAKMRLRHPHVYGEAEEAPDWEVMKAEDRADTSPDTPFRSVPRSLEPLSRAYRVQQKAAGAGFDWPEIRGAIAKLREEIEEVEALLERERKRVSGDAPSDRLEEEIGDLLFAAVNVARMGHVQPSTALSRATLKFERRYTALVREARERQIDVRSASLEELDRLWEDVKEER